MELSLKKDHVAYCDCVFEKSVKQSLDLAWNLPDYCSDIQRILQCTVTPCINGVSVTGGRANAIGEVQIRFIYLNDQNRIDCFGETTELSAAAELGSLPENAITLALAAVDYTNARAASPRRFTLSGAVSVLFRTFAQKMQPMLCDIENCGGQTKGEDVPCLSLLGCAEKTFDLSETVELPEHAKTIDKLLHAEAALSMDSHKTVNGKLLLRGELSVDIFYLADGDDQTIARYEHKMPISQIIEVPNVTEDALCDIILHLQCLRVMPRTDSSGRMRLIDIMTQVSAFVKAYEKTTRYAVCDCYATELPLRVQRREMQFSRHQQTYEKTMKAKQTLGLGEQQIQAVAAVYAQTQNALLKPNEQEWSLFVETTVHLLCRMKDGNYAHFERIVEISESIFAGSDETRLTGALMSSVTSVQAKILNQSDVEINIECSVFGEIYELFTRTVCIDAVADESVKTKQPSALTLYFSQKGESIWNIAKQYRTTVAAIQTENGLDSDTVQEERILLVPAV